MNEPRKPRSKTAVLVIVVVIVLIGIGLYYTVALRNSDTRPESVETQSAITILPQR